MRSQTKPLKSPPSATIKCSRCKGDRVQRDYDDAFAVMRLAGMRKLLCNDCGHVFNGFDPFGKVPRVAAKRSLDVRNRRRSPRFPSHLPTSISLIDHTPSNNKISYSAATHGHCDAINEHGMGLSLVGSRFNQAELTRVGRLLLIRIRLPEATVEAVVSVLNHHRVVENKNKKWVLGVKLQQISETDKENLMAYLKKRELSEPLPT